MLLLKFNHKQIRSEVIKGYMALIGLDKAVCFSCGNASRALKEAGVVTLDISDSGDLVANRWFRPYEVAKTFGTYFDATSGHLPLHLMADIAQAFKKELGVLSESEYLIPTGSGETIICLQIAYPDIKFVAQYNMNKATEYSKDAPLNEVVASLFEVRGINQ